MIARLLSVNHYSFLPKPLSQAALLHDDMLILSNHTGYAAFFVSATLMSTFSCCA